jgi:hypothetical protein
MEEVTPESVREYKGFTDKFLCPRSANVYNVRFRKFRVRDLESGFTLFEVADDSPDQADEQIQEIKEDENETIENSMRTIRYHLGPDFLDLKDLGSSLTFSVGAKPVKDLLMIERHYFRDLLIKSFEFKFDFCIPNSTNTWESIYTIPEMDPKLKQDMIDHPWETRSDSFYFVEDKLIMHNKAIYNYGPFES